MQIHISERAIKLLAEMIDEHEERIQDAMACNLQIPATALLNDLRAVGQLRNLHDLLDRI